MRIKKFDIGKLKKIEKPHTQFVAKSEAVVFKAEKVKTKPKGVFFRIAAFTFVCVVMISLLHSIAFLSSAKNASGEILGAATEAYDDLNSAGKNLGQQNFTEASQLFESAQNHVKAAQNKLNNYKVLAWIAPEANSADRVLAGAGFLAEAGSKLSSAFDFLNELKVSSKGVETPNFGDKVAANMAQLNEINDLVFKAGEQFERAGKMPLDYEGTLDLAKADVATLHAMLGKLIALEDLYLNVFNSNKTYFLIFQNYDEARATGGFIGTYGVLKINHGQIAKLKIDSIYNLDGQIFEQVAAPGPFQPLISRWGIRDANWFADFPTSAKKLLYFFEKGGETADGVISVTPQVLEDLLSLVGPIEMEEHGTTLSADNFQEVVQLKTSVEYDKELNQPKQFLADFAPRFLDRLSNLKADSWFNFFQIMQDNLNQKQILVYSTDANTQKIISELGFGGSILQTEHDYLAIINSNFGGTKTDLKVTQSVSLQSKILSDGSIFNTLTINRKNTADANNKDYMRVMVPLGSQLVSATGFDNDSHYSSEAKSLRTDPDLAAWDQGEVQSNIFVRVESGKTEFAGWLNVLPQSERSVTLTYMLPFEIKSNFFGQSQSHSLLLQKQSGSKPMVFTGSLNLGGYSSSWVSGGILKSAGVLNFNSNSNMDDFWGFVLSK